MCRHVAFLICCDLCDRWFHGSCVGLLRRPTERSAWFCPGCVTQQAAETDVDAERRLLLNFYNEASLRAQAPWNEWMNAGRGAHDVVDRPGCDVELPVSAAVGGGDARESAGERVAGVGGVDSFRRRHSPGRRGEGA